MLPDFPSLKSKRAEALQSAAYERSMRRHGVLPQMKAFRQHEGASERILGTTVDGDAVDSPYERVTSGITFTREELPTLDDAALFAKLERITNDLTDAQMRLLIKRVEEAAASTGNVVHGQGEPLSEKHLLEIFSKVELDFDGDQIADGYAFLAAPAMAERLSTMEVSDDFKRVYAQIVEQQRLQWRLRQADRKLVD